MPRQRWCLTPNHLNITVSGARTPDKVMARSVDMLSLTYFLFATPIVPSCKLPAQRQPADNTFRVCGCDLHDVKLDENEMK